jgi:hypothetical protein
MRTNRGEGQPFGAGQVRADAVTLNLRDNSIGETTRRS